MLGSRLSLDPFGEITAFTKLRDLTEEREKKGGKLRKRMLGRGNEEKRNRVGEQSQRYSMSFTVKSVLVQFNAL